MPNFNPTYRVTLRVERFESVPGEDKQPGRATIAVVWVVRGATDTDVLSGRSTFTEPVSGSDFDALAAAHSRALAKVSADIATAIRSIAK